jgi:hypothetical protein
MDQATLVDGQIEEGRKLIDRLIGEGFPVTAAAWVKESESGRWYLYLATPLVPPQGGTREAYRRLNAVRRQMPPPFWIGPFQVKVVGSGSPLAEAVQELHRRYPGNRLIPFEGPQLGGLSIEGAYVYPPAAAPVE